MEINGDMIIALLIGLFVGAVCGVYFTLNQCTKECVSRGYAEYYMTPEGKPDWRFIPVDKLKQKEP